MGEVVRLRDEESVVENWLKKYESKDTIRTYKNCIKDFFGIEAEYVNDYRLKQIKYIDVQNYVKEMVNRKLGSNTIRKNISGLKSLFEYATDEKVIEENYFSGKRVKNLLKVNLEKGNKVKVALGKEEIVKLLDNIKEDRDHLLVNLALHLGLRVEELIGLKWNSFYEIEGKWYVNIFGKGRKNRVLPIKEKVIGELKKYGKWKGELGIDDRKIFNMGVSNVNKILKKYCDKSGVRKIKSHDMRRTFATGLIKNGIGVFELRSALGHESVASSQRYFIDVENMNDKVLEYMDW